MALVCIIRATLLFASMKSACVLMVATTTSRRDFDISDSSLVLKSNKTVSIYRWAQTTQMLTIYDKGSSIIV